MKNSTENWSYNPDETLFDLEYADNIVCTFETSMNAESLLGSLICSIARMALNLHL